MEDLGAFESWLYREQAEFDTDSLNKSEIALAKAAWQAAKSKLTGRDDCNEDGAGYAIMS